LRRSCRLASFQRLRNLSALAPPLSAGHDAQHRALVLAAGATSPARDARARRACLVSLAALGGSCAEMLLMVEPPSDRGAAATHNGKDRRMIPETKVVSATMRSAACTWAVLTIGLAQAQMPMPPGPPSVTVTASATASVANDRMQASMRAEAENASAAAAA